MRFRFFILSAIVLLLSSCAKERMEQVDVPGDSIRLSSFRQQVITRADVDELAFAKDTKYTLLAVNTSTDPTAYEWSTQKGFTTQPQEGAESEDHAILYSPVSIFSVGKHLDFYGLTFDKTDSAPALDATPADGVNPTISLNESSDRLPDLMHSNTIKNRTYTDGIITMPFEHALAAVNFYISKQNEDGDDQTARQLERVKVTEIRLDNVATAATMDVVDGKWSWAASASGSRVVYSDASGKVVPKLAAPIGDTDVLVFPNDDYVDGNNAYDANSPYKYYTPAGDGSANKCEQVIVTVKLEGLEEWDNNIPGYKAMNKTLTCGAEVVNGAVEVSFPLRNYHETTGEDVGPLHFLRNHKYILSVFVMRDNVRIVAISPQVYEWVSVDLNSAEYDHNVTSLGQPVTFGGTVWMDRNLGAKSADCEGDWLHTVGYYWEYARNIPFMLDWDVFEAKGYKVSNDNVIVYSNGNTVAGTAGASPAWPDYFVYTYDNNGQKVSGYLTETLGDMRASNPGKTDREIVAIDPGDTGTYAYIWARGTSNWGYWYEKQAAEFTNTYWYSKENQPVPKGWRLPEPRDVYSIMPEESFNWYSTSARFVTIGVPDPKQTSGTAQTYAGDYKYQFIYGNIKVNPNASPSANYSAPIRNSDLKTRLYGIKHQGTSQAYRYMIEMHTSNVPNGNYVRFSQFPTSKDDVFTITGSGDNRQWNLHKFDWEHPSAYLDFPMTGQFGQGTFTLFGREIKIRLREHSGNQTLCMKLSNDGTGVYGTWMTTTCPTRLVRDLD